MLMSLMLEGFSIGNFLGSLQGSMVNYVKIIITIIGVVMVGFGVFQIAKNLISHGKAQANWVVTFALILIGGTLMLTSGFDLLKNLGQSGKGTIENMAGGQADLDKGGYTELETIVVNGSVFSIK